MLRPFSTDVSSEKRGGLAKSASGLLRIDRPEGISASCGSGGTARPLKEICIMTGPAMSLTSYHKDQRGIVTSINNSNSGPELSWGRCTRLQGS